MQLNRTLCRKYLWLSWWILLLNLPMVTKCQTILLKAILTLKLHMWWNQVCMFLEQLHLQSNWWGVNVSRYSYLINIRAFDVSASSLLLQRGNVLGIQNIFVLRSALGAYLTNQTYFRTHEPESFMAHLIAWCVADIFHGRIFYVVQYVLL